MITVSLFDLVLVITMSIEFGIVICAAIFDKNLPEHVFGKGWRDEGTF